MNRAVVIDIESLGVDMNATILSVGAVSIDLDDPEGTDDRHLYKVVALTGKIDVETDTLAWWLKQSEMADKLSELLNSSNTNYMEVILSQLGAMVEEANTVWGYGAAFDNAMINQVSRTLTGEPCWSYKKDRCLRTLVNVLPGFVMPTRPDDHTKHHALHDAIHQARVLREAMAYAEKLRLPAN